MESVYMLPFFFYSDRPAILLIGGGNIGESKSNLYKHIINSTFWRNLAHSAVVVEVYPYSTDDAASSLLVTALNQGRNVILKTTLSCESFVYQTIDMVRNVHKRRYHIGKGYKVEEGEEGGNITENYWEADTRVELNEDELKWKPYIIDLVAMICDEHLAIARGIRRALHTGLAVREKSQLKSHKMFASTFRGYSHLVERARLYWTNSMDGDPDQIAMKDAQTNILIRPETVKNLNLVAILKKDAVSIHVKHKSKAGWVGLKRYCASEFNR